MTSSSESLAALINQSMKVRIGVALQGITTDFECTHIIPHLESNKLQESSIAAIKAART